MASTERATEPAALGWSVHTGWAVAVLLAGPLEAPRVLARERVVLADEAAFDERRFVYHRSQELPLAQAERAVRATTAEARRRAQAAVAALVAAARAQKHRVIGAGIGLAERRLPGLAEILRSHALVHAAEGQLFGRALVAGSEAAGLSVLLVPPRELAARAGEVLELAPAALGTRLAALGKRAGRPWAQDQRTAALLALLVLAGR